MAVPFVPVTLRRAILACLAVAATTAACSTPTASTGAGNPTTPVTTSSTASPTSTTPAPSTTAPSAPAPQARTKASLKKALLEVSDMPSGFSEEPTSSGQSGGPTISSKDARCADLVSLMNARTAPGSLASAEASFSAGQSGPSIDESLDALGSEAKVSALQARLKAALGRCSKVTMSIPGHGRSTMHVATVNPPKVGTAPVAARITGEGGPLDGFELTQVYTGVGDVVLSLTFVGATPDDIDGASGLAHDKAASLLGLDGTKS